MRDVLSFAELMLSREGGFLPFGGAMRQDGALVPVAGYDGREYPPPVDIIRLIKDGFIEAAQRGEFKATAVVYDVRAKIPGTEEKSDAIEISLDHRDDYSVIVIFPYKISDGKPIIGTAFAHKGEADIFRRDK